MKANEVRKMSGEELQTKLQDLKKDLFNLRLQHATNQLDNPIRIAEVKNRAGICLPIADPEGIGGPGGQIGGLQGSLPCTAVLAVFSVLTRLQRT